MLLFAGVFQHLRKKFLQPILLLDLLNEFVLFAYDRRDVLADADGRLQLGSDVSWARLCNEWRCTYTKDVQRLS